MHMYICDSLVRAYVHMWQSRTCICTYVTVSYMHMYICDSLVHIHYNSKFFFHPDSVAVCQFGPCWPLEIGCLKKCDNSQNQKMDFFEAVFLLNRIQYGPRLSRSDIHSCNWWSKVTTNLISTKNFFRSIHVRVYVSFDLKDWDAWMSLNLAKSDLGRLKHSYLIRLTLSFNF
jgi:hypothetical protein